MPSPASPKIPEDQLHIARSEGTKGFFSGAARFASVSIIGHLLGSRFSPIYRGLTVQFKVFLQIAAMTLGGFIAAERRVKEYEDFIRRRNRAMTRSNRAWSDLEEQELKYGIERRESGE